MVGCINHSLRFGWVVLVVPGSERDPGPIATGGSYLKIGVCQRCLTTTAAAYGSLRSQGRQIGQFKLTLNS